MSVKDLQLLIPEPEHNRSVFDALGSNTFDVLVNAAKRAYMEAPSINDILPANNLIHSNNPDIQYLIEYDNLRSRKLSEAEFNNSYADSGLEYDPNMTEESVKELIDKRKEREIYDYIISRGKGGIAEAIGKFGVELVAGNLSVVNIAASFIPIGGQARWANAALKYGKLPAGLAKGFVGGAVGQGIIEPFMHLKQAREQRQYGAADSAANILSSGLFGSVLHGIGYGVGHGVNYLKNKSNLDKLKPELTTDSPDLTGAAKAPIIEAEDLYIARSQLNDGKHIELENTAIPESFYKDFKLDESAAKAPDITEQLAALEHEIGKLPDSIQMQYSKSSARLSKKFKYSDELNISRRNIALNIIRQVKAEEFIGKHVNKTKGIKEYLRQTDLRQEAISKELLFGLINDLEEHQVIREFRDPDYNDAIIQELWNLTHPDKVSTGSKTAAKVASIIHKHQQVAISRANLAGGHIVPLEGYITKQSHNSTKLREAGYEQWLEFTMPLLDLKRTKKACSIVSQFESVGGVARCSSIIYSTRSSRLATESNLTDYVSNTKELNLKGLNLKKIYHNLATEIHLRDTDEYLTTRFGRGGQGNRNILAALEASRKLHFKSAQAWLKYQQEFGYYQKPDLIDKILNPVISTRSFIADSVAGNLDILGKSIGILENMGSEPQAMLQRLQTGFIKELQEKAVRSDYQLKQLNSLKASSKFTGQLEIMLGVRPEVPALSRILSSYRALKCMSNLGGTVISSFPDAATFVAELQNNGIGFIDSYKSLLKLVTNSFDNQNRKEFGKLLKIGTDSLLGGSYARMSSEYRVAGSIAKTTDAFFKLNFMEKWDSAWKSTVAEILASNLALEVAKPFKSLYPNLQTLLNRYGINEANWHLYKSLVKEVKGNNYLIPDSNLFDEGLLQLYLMRQGHIVNSFTMTGLKQDLITNLRTYLIDRVDTAIPTPHSSEKAAIQLANMGIKPGSAAAAVVQCLMQFKSFAYSYIARPLKSITLDQIPTHQQSGYGMFDVDTWRDLARTVRNPATLKIFLQLLLGTTALGYLSINASRMLKGQELLSPEEEGVFTASLMKGGGLGLYGDFIFGEYDRYGHNLLESLTGPIGSDVIDIGKIYSKAKKGNSEEAIRLTQNLLKRNIPGRNLFYLQPALFMIPEE